MVDASKEIRRAVDTGKVAFGYKQAQKELMKGNGEIVVVSSNMPENEKEKIKNLAQVHGKKVFEFDGQGLVLGSVCGKPFVISTMIVLDVGKSQIMEINK